MKNVLIFDYDGVIVDSLDIFMKDFISACDKNGFNQVKTKEIFLNLFDGNMYESMVKLGIAKDKIPSILEDLKLSLLSDQDRLSLFDGINNMLKEFSKENKVIIITSNVTKVVEEFLKSRGVNYFEEIIGAEKETSKVKKIEAIKSQHSDRQYFYIGVTKGDIVEGRKAGVKTIAVTWGWHSEERLKQENPDYIIRSPVELEKLFKGPLLKS